MQRTANVPSHNESESKPLPCCNYSFSLYVPINNEQCKLFIVGNNVTRVQALYIQMPDNFSLVAKGQISPLIAWEQLNSQQEISLDGSRVESGMLVNYCRITVFFFNTFVPPTCMQIVLWRKKMQ